MIRANRREAQGIAERKKTLAAMLANVAELGAERMEETIGKAGLRDAAIGTGVAMDKMLALTGQTPGVPDSEHRHADAVDIGIASVSVGSREDERSRANLGQRTIDAPILSAILNHAGKVSA